MDLPDLLVNRGEPKTNFFLFPPLMLAPQQAISESISEIALDVAGNDQEFVIFISIPYCRVRCHSCHCFKHVLPRRDDESSFLDPYVDAICCQLKGFGESRRFQSMKCGAVYIGGGTGSLLRPADLKRIFDLIRSQFKLTPGVELTLEGSPLEFTPDYLAVAQDCGVQRLSIGFQSRFDEILEALNSPHRSPAGLQSIENAMKAGFATVNVDLLYNVPRQSKELWQQDVIALADSGVDSISLGDYIIFPDSPSAKLIERGSLPPQLGQGEAYEWFLWATDELSKRGYEEQVRGIFPKAGHEHVYVTLSCLENTEIIGIGAGAFSFVAGRQLKNTGNVARYIDDVGSGRFLSIDQISRVSSLRDLQIRFMIHNLFASQVDLERFQKRFALSADTVFADEFERLSSAGWIEMNDQFLFLTTEGRKMRKYVYDVLYRTA